MDWLYQDNDKRNDIVVDKCMRTMFLAWVQQGDCLREEIPFIKKASMCMGDDRAAEEIVHVSGTHQMLKLNLLYACMYVNFFLCVNFNFFLSTPGND